MEAQSGSHETVARVRFTRRGVGVGAAGALCVLAYCVVPRSELLVGGVILLAAPLLALFTLAVGRPRLSVRRFLSTDVLSVGESIVSTVRIHNLGDRPSPAASWCEVATEGVLQAPLVAVLPSLDQRRLGAFFGPDSLVQRSELTACHRGIGAVGPVAVLRRDPFGFAAAEYRIGPAQPIMVTPRVTGLDTAAFDPLFGDAGRADLRRPLAPGPDELTARPYRPGDPLRRIHWRATARQDALMVRQEEEHTTPQAIVYLDVRSPASPEGSDTRRTEGASADASSFESALELTASVAVRLSEAGYELSAVMSGPSGEAIGSAPDMTTTRSRLLAALAVVGPAPWNVDDCLGELAVIVERMQAPVPVIAVLCRADEAVAARLGALRSGADPAIAFLFESDQRAAEVGRRLRASGWRCVVVGAGRSVASAWRSATWAAAGSQDG